MEVVHNRCSTDVTKRGEEPQQEKVATTRVRPQVGGQTKGGE